MPVSFSNVLAHADAEPTPELASNILWPSMRVIGLQVKHLTGVSKELNEKTARLIRLVETAESVALDNHGRSVLRKAIALVAQQEGE